MAAKRFRQDNDVERASQPSRYGVPERGQAAAGRPVSQGGRTPRFSSDAARGAGRSAAVSPDQPAAASRFGRSASAAASQPAIAPRHSARPAAPAQGAAQGQAAHAPRFSNDAVSGQATAASPSGRAPRFSAHQAQGAHGAAASVRGRGVHGSRFSSSGQAAAPVTSTSGATGAYVAEGSPRPISVDPATTGSFSTIRQGRGAVATTRENAGRAAEAGRASAARTVRAGQGTRKKPQPSKAPLPVLVGIGVAALVVVVLAVVLLSALISPKAPEGDEAATSVAAETVVSANEGVESGGFTYSLSQGEGGWELVRSSGGQDTSLATLAGEPVCVTLYQGTLFIPENLSDGTWDVICYVLGDGSTATQLLGGDGNPVTGSGTVQSASVDGSNLVLTGDGVNQSVALE